MAILGNPGMPIVGAGGFHMAVAGPPVQLQVPTGWQGRIWARASCNFSGDNGTACDPPYQPCCASGSCLMADGRFGLHCAESGLAPTSLVEMSLDNTSPYGPYDVYDVSMVDGWSIPLSLDTVEGTYNAFPDPGAAADTWCTRSGCLGAPRCPGPFRLNSTTLSCWSPCEAAVNQNLPRDDIVRACCVCTTSDPH